MPSSNITRDAPGSCSVLTEMKAAVAVGRVAGRYQPRYPAPGQGRASGRFGEDKAYAEWSRETAPASIASPLGRRSIPETCENRPGPSWCRARHGRERRYQRPSLQPASANCRSSGGCCARRNPREILAVEKAHPGRRTFLRGQVDDGILGSSVAAQEGCHVFPAALPVLSDIFARSKVCVDGVT